MSNFNSPVTSAKRKSNNKAFYETQTDKPTSSQIIKEAREKLNDPLLQQQQSSSSSLASNSATRLSPSHSLSNSNSNLPQAGYLRTLPTNRPFTPRDDKRSLFGTKSVRPVNERPPSAFEVKSKSFDITDQSRPSSGTRLSPIERKQLDLSQQQSLFKSQKSIEEVVNETVTNNNETEIPHPLEKTKRRSTKASLLPQLNHSTSIEKRVNEINSPNTNSTITNRSETIILSAANEETKKLNEDNYSIIYECLNDRKTSAGKTQSKEPDPEEEKYWKNTLKPHFNDMINLHKEKQNEDFCKACYKLYDLLEAKQMLGKSSSKRTNILKILFKFLDTDNDQIKIKLSRIILAFEVGTNNLTNICRLLFSLTRKEENDPLFLQDNLLDLFLNSSERLDFKSNSDSIVYFCGALKNLSGNNKLLKELSNKNLVKLLGNISKNLSQFYKENELKKSEAGHALVQLTATLRNLADLPHNREKFINCQIVEELSNALKYFTGDSDLMLNISRIFSKLTLHSDCCTLLSDCSSCYKSFIKIMIKHDSKQDLIVRTGFILGNLTSRNDSARLRYVSEKHSIETLINLLKIYLDLDIKSTDSLNKNLQPEAEINEREPTENEDVMIKIIRVIANLSINEQIGNELSKREDCLNILLKILDMKSLINDELVINTIVTLNNLSFYDSDLFVNRSLDLINSLMKYLLSNNFEAILEVFRVFANLTRHRIVRNYLVDRKVDLMAIALLDSGNHELVYIVIGVLINLMADDDKREILKKEDGVMKLIEVLSDFGRNDWQIASMVCKVFMNFSEKITSCNTCFGEPQTALLQAVLNEFLDEEFILQNIKLRQNVQPQNDDNMNDYVYNLWLEDFCPVAQRLLQRIKTNQSQFESL